MADPEELDPQEQLAAEHDALMADLGDVADGERTPTQDVADLMGTLDGFGESAAPSDESDAPPEAQSPRERVQARAAKHAAERKARLGQPPPKARPVQQVRAAHGEAMAELGAAARRESRRDEAEPKPLAMDEPDIERMIEPDIDTNPLTASALSDHATSERQWKAAVFETFRQMAADSMYFRNEIEQLRSRLERDRS